LNLFHHFQMPIIAADTGKARPHCRIWPLKILDEQVGPADQRASDVVARIVCACRYQNAVQHILVEPERTRGVDHTAQRHGLSFPQRHAAIDACPLASRKSSTFKRMTDLNAGGTSRSRAVTLS